AVAPAAVRFVQIGADGARIGTPHRIGPGAGIHSLIWNGTSYALSHHAARPGTSDIDVFFARLDTSGALIGVELDVTTDVGNSFIPQIAWTGMIYGIAFIDSRGGTYFARVDANGAEISQEAPVGNGGAARIGSDGHSFAITWKESDTRSHLT